MTRTAATLLVLLALAGGCRKAPAVETVPGLAVSGRVSLRQTPAATSDNTDWASRVYPARMSRPVLPDYPPEGLEARVPGATVRVEFTIDTAGRARAVRAVALEAVPHAAAFEAACAEVADRWRFSPAWRLRRESDPTDQPVIAVESRAFLEFSFDLALHDAGGAVEVRFGDGTR